MSEFPDQFFSIQSPKQSQLKIRGSKFIASVFPVEKEKEAEELIQKVRKEYCDATHHCFAYKVKSKTGDDFKICDAGEPKGTAGNQILAAIESRNFSNILVVVTRYFGGTKLGKGGLHRAYHQVAADALDKCRIIEKFLSEQHLIAFPMSLVGKVSQVLDKFGVEVLKRDFKLEGHIKIKVRLSQSEKLKESLTQVTKGMVKFEN